LEIISSRWSPPNHCSVCRGVDRLLLTRDIIGNKGPKLLMWIRLLYWTKARVQVAELQATGYKKQTTREVSKETKCLTRRGIQTAAAQTPTPRSMSRAVRDSAWLFCCLHVRIEVCSRNQARHEHWQAEFRGDSPRDGSLHKVAADFQGYYRACRGVCDRRDWTCPQRSTWRTPHRGSFR
jgi:hypothetical protein